MQDYLLIESRDPFESKGSARYQELAAGLITAGGTVTLFLVEDGVLATRGAPAERLSQLASDGVEVLADGFALAERGIDEGRLPEGVSSASLEVVVDQLAAGRKTMWH